MAAKPIILSTGSSSGAGTAGQGRNDLEISETVTLSDTEAANSGASYVWEMVERPEGSSATLSGPLTSTPTFVPDVTGSYMINCVVDGAFGDTEVLAVPLATTGARIPAFGEKLEYDGSGNVKGWHEALTVFMRQVDSLMADRALLSASNTFTGAQGNNPTTLTDGASIPVNASQSNSFTLTISASSGTLENPTNLIAGFTYLFRIQQSAGGSETLSFGTAYKFEGGSAPTITATSNAVDIITAYCPDGTNLECGVLQDVK